MNGSPKIERTALYSGHRGAVHTVVGTAHPNQFLSAGADGRVVLWDNRTPEAGEVIADALKGIYSLHLDTLRNLLFIGNEAGGLHVIGLAEKEELRLLHAHRRGIFTILPLGTDRLVCSGGDGCLTIWRIPGMELERTIPLSDMKLRGMAVDPTGTSLAIAGSDGTIRVLDTIDLNERFTLSGHERGAASVAWHPTKPVLMSGGRDGQLRFWHTEQAMAPLHVVPAHRANIYAIAFSADGSVCGTASRDKTLKFWRASDLELLGRGDLKNGGHTHSVNALLPCADGTWLSASDDKTVRGWRCVTS